MDEINIQSWKKMVNGWIQWNFY